MLSSRNLDLFQVVYYFKSPLEVFRICNARFLFSYISPGSQSLVEGGNDANNTSLRFHQI